MDSALVCAASFTKPQFSCIFACRKYWLMAVSSPVSWSFRNSRTRLSPCMGGEPSECAGGRAAEDHLVDVVMTGSAGGARSGVVAHRLDGARAGLDGRHDLGVGHGMAHADVHGPHPPQVRRA